MSDPADTKKEEKTAAPIVEDRSYVDLLKTLMGKTVTMVNPESYEHAPLGHQIRAGFYRAKLTGMGSDYIICVTQYVKTGKDARKEPVKQFIPMGRISRISVMKSEILLHL